MLTVGNEKLWFCGWLHQRRHVCMHEILPLGGSANRYRQILTYVYNRALQAPGEDLLFCRLTSYSVVCCSIKCWGGWYWYFSDGKAWRETCWISVSLGEEEAQRNGDTGPDAAGAWHTWSVWQFACRKVSSSWLWAVLGAPPCSPNNLYSKGGFGRQLRGPRRLMVGD